MPKNDDYFDLWIPMGFLLGVSSVGLSYTFFAYGAVSSFVKEYQTLLAGTIAVFTAAWTVKSTVRQTEKQIQSAQEIEDTRRAERLMVARSMLPFALSEMVQYCSNTVSELSNVLQWRLESKKPVYDNTLSLASGSVTVVEMPISILERVGKVFESAPKNIAHELGQVLTHSQICFARLKDLETVSINGVQKIRNDNNYRHVIIDFCELYARVCRFYDFARFRAESVREGLVTLQEMRAASSLLNVTIEDDEFEVLLRRYPADSTAI